MTNLSEGICVSCLATLSISYQSLHGGIKQKLSNPVQKYRIRGQHSPFHRPVNMRQQSTKSTLDDLTAFDSR
ncbi:uncharacterized protein PHALS_14845 [Plasmopara halstedii]|uniref:Uncharacterized protein n=1 Tax=Plasmopara halstedii TaxID=4781 RepID=A0A0P1A6M4_PLAHL|nr:uncharacterized protein PHALS_14845 [Plasmopara halstedii]CEG36266.1 hypothetical protein PHALS_14845 [Plasmopara halstedii]|eukprot:XP_024572635.1 hypothetical protein PHALS_14845 [Plasmopara halstedii]